MSKKPIIAYFIITIGLALLLLATWFASESIAVLNPKGLIADKQRDLINVSLFLMLIVVVPVFILTFFIIWKYRAGNKKAKYTPDWDHSYVAETVWWGFPFIIILILSVIAYKSTHELDPYKPIENGTKPLTIQVVALQWKWLFIYPEQKIATVNFIQFPQNTPIQFEITADAPMNSFWIPQLGGQIYAMPGMKTKLSLIAEELGSYRGSSANLSGKGFAGMTFEAKASSNTDFEQWVQGVQNSSQGLDLNDYEQLAKPSEYHPQAFFQLKKEDLFNWIVMKPMEPTN